MIEWGVAGRPLPGEAVSGDNYVVSWVGDTVLLAVIDGLGHGPDAADASSQAVAYLECRAGAPLDVLVAGCHTALRRTRGVVLSLAHIETASGLMTWLGVGNVDGQLIRAGRAGREVLLQRGGVVGYQIPQLQPRSAQLALGDTVFLATDGIRPGYAWDMKAEAVQAAAENLLAGCARATDDALILVARVTEEPT
jgi:serine phosphatase RsbU (regulator of sigma subunit)